MGLADRLKSGIEPATVKCKLRDTAAAMKQDDADALMELVWKRRDLSAGRVATVLREEKVQLSEEVVRRHRKGECRVCGEG